MCKHLTFCNNNKIIKSQKENLFWWNLSKETLIVSLQLYFWDRGILHFWLLLFNNQPPPNQYIYVGFFTSDVLWSVNNFNLWRNKIVQRYFKVSTIISSLFQFQCTLSGYMWNYGCRIIIFCHLLLWILKVDIFLDTYGYKHVCLSSDM